MVSVPDERIRELLPPPNGIWKSKPPLRDAAVLAPVFAQDGEDHILFTRRRGDLRSHAGEVSFPGGSREGDEDALACALRESQEEIGLAPDRVEVLGRLPERPSIAGFQVHVFVGRIVALHELQIDEREVQHLLTIPIGELARQDRWDWRDADHPKLPRRVPFFEHEGDVLWGLTARLTLDLLERVLD